MNTTITRRHASGLFLLNSNENSQFQLVSQHLYLEQALIDIKVNVTSKLFHHLVHCTTENVVVSKKLIPSSQRKAVRAYAVRVAMCAKTLDGLIFHLNFQMISEHASS